MFRHGRFAVYGILLLTPILAWHFAVWRTHRRTREVTLSQRREGEARYARFMELARRQAGIAVGQPLRFPFSYQAVGPAPPLADGHCCLLRVVSHLGRCWDAVAWKHWSDLLERCPQLMLVSIIASQQLTTEDVNELRAGFSHPRAFFLHTDDPNFWERFADLGDTFLIDGHGILRATRLLEDACYPSEAEKATIAGLVTGADLPQRSAR